jgi:uncharacterized protein
MNLLKPLLILLGSLFLCIGIIGIFVPGLPTTPFLLLTAGFYIRSSERLYHRLISNQWIGPFILDFQRKKGMTIKTKIVSIGTMWSMILLSCIFFLQTLTSQLIVVATGLVGSIVMGFVVPTVRK